MEHLKLHTAAQKGDVETLRKCIDAGFDVNARTQFGETPLLLAAQTGQGVCVEALLKANANPNIPRYSIAELKAAGKIQGDLSALNIYGESPLVLAAGENHVQIVSLLARAGADVNAVRSDGISALIIAAYFGHAETVKVLLACGADRSKTYQGRTAAQIAVAAGHPATARMFDADMD